MPGRAYYRLRQVELNGGVEYSPILTVTFSLEQDGLVQVFPNPVQKEITILLENGAANEAACVLYDRAGRELMRRSWQFQLSSEEKLDVSALLPGLYIYQVRVGDRTYHGKLLKL